MNFTLVRSRRKSISVEIRSNAEVIVRAPVQMPSEKIQAFLEKKQKWILSHLAKIQAKQIELQPKWTAEELETLIRRAQQYIPERVAYFAPMIGVDYGKISIGKQCSRWGSCSSTGNLRFNCVLMACPAPVLDYVVVHELCHRRQMNHSTLFWREVSHIMPDYQIHRAWLKEHGGPLIDRLR